MSNIRTPHLGGEILRNDSTGSIPELKFYTRRPVHESNKDQRLEFMKNQCESLRNDP